MKKTILVTGGAGFLGSHLCDRLLREGFAVIAMDNLLTGTTDNIAHLAGREDFRFIHHDVTEYIYLDGPLYAVLHFASPASPRDYHELPIQTLKVGSLGTHKALGLAKAKGARFLLASTSEVYGDPLVHPQPETYWGNVNPVGPRGVYDEAKRFAEAHGHGLPPRARRGHEDRAHLQYLRPAHAPERRAGHPQFHDAGAARRAHHRLRRRQQTRSFCYVADLVDGHLPPAAVRPARCRSTSGTPRSGRCGRWPRRSASWPAASPVVYEPLPVDDPKVRQPDITLARG